MNCWRSAAGAKPKGGDRCRSYKLIRLTHYFGGLCAVSDFNLDLAAGELVGIIGPNGAGKTTVFNLITGVYRPSAGEHRFWMGTELVGKRPNQITDFGYCPHLPDHSPVQ